MRLLPLALCLLPQTTFAYELYQTNNGADLYWHTQPIAYDVLFVLEDEDGEALSRAARRAFDNWAASSRGAVQPRYTGTATEAVPHDGRSTLALIAVWDEQFGERDRTVAHTELIYDTSTGDITEADILMNGEAFVFGGAEPGVLDSESVFLHELGHVLGIGHSCGDPGTTFPSCFSIPENDRERILEAVMAPSMAPGVSKRELQPDDLDALFVHHAGTATVPELTSIARDCIGSGRATLVGTFPPPTDGSLEVRYASGYRDALPVDPGPNGTWLLEEERLQQTEGSVDLLVSNGEAYGSLVGIVLPEPCKTKASPPPPVEEGGCQCSSSHHGYLVYRHQTGFGFRLFLGSLLVVLLMRFSMLKTARRKTAALLFVLLLTSAVDAHAYRCSRVAADFGASLVWPTREVLWWADTKAFSAIGDPTLGEQEVKASYQVWEDIDCSDMTLPFQGTEEGLRAGFNENGPNKNVVAWVTANWMYDKAAIAVTTSAFDTQSGVVVDSDIELNGQEFTFALVDGSCAQRSGLMDLRNTITHEVGHVLGLDHPPNTSRYEETTMYASAPPCEIKKRSLAQDDIDGICTIYPKGAPTQQCFTPDGPSFLATEEDNGFGCSAHRVPRSSMVWFALIGSFLLMRRSGS